MTDFQWLDLGLSDTATRIQSAQDLMAEVTGQLAAAQVTGWSGGAAAIADQKLQEAQTMAGLSTTEMDEALLAVAALQQEWLLIGRWSGGLFDAG